MKAARGLLTLATAILVSCGGSGGGSEATLAPPPGNDTPPADNGIDRGGVARGVITGFGSIFVNGVRYDTSSAVFTIDDAPGSEADLAVGKIVTVVGVIDEDGENGTADEVTFDDEVEGPIDSIDVAGGTLVVLGQTVLVNAETQFDDSIVPNGLEGLSEGQVVEVSGFVGADGSITATHIELTDDTEFEVTGVVSGLDTAAMTFLLNDLVVDYSGATLEEFPDGQIEDGMRVEAEGTMFGAAGELIASTVEFEEDDFLSGDDDDDGDTEIEIEGLITRFVSATDFDVSGFPVTTDDSTEYENGSASDLAEDVRIEVEGVRDEAGVLVAEEVSFRPVAEIEIEAPVDAVDAEGGSVTVLGIVIGTTATTQFEDDSDQDAGAFSLSDLNVGDWVKLTAFAAADGGLVATQLERDEAEDEIRVEALVDAVAQPDFEMLGLTIQTDDNTEFEDANDMPLSADDFFAQVTSGSEVQVEGTVIGDGVILASEVELEADD
ncbi:MAG: hypothetical protein HKN06_10380 [Gammaproteobacteria bacterium]|nr:hypothetical protein [Gammaproteobacteria bacterium]